MAKKPAPTKGAKSLADFRATHDKSFVIPNKIKAALAKLGDGGWEYATEFAKLAEISVNDLSRFATEFGDFVVVAKSNGREYRIWAGSKALAAKMREMAN